MPNKTSIPHAAEAATLLSVAAAAARLGVSTKTIRRQISVGALPHHRIGARVLVARADLQAYLARHRTAEL